MNFQRERMFRITCIFRVKCYIGIFLSHTVHEKQGINKLEYFIKI